MAVDYDALMKRKREQRRFDIKACIVAGILFVALLVVLLVGNSKHFTSSYTPSSERGTTAVYESTTELMEYDT